MTFHLLAGISVTISICSIILTPVTLNFIHFPTVHAQKTSSDSSLASNNSSMQPSKNNTTTKTPINAGTHISLSLKTLQNTGTNNVKQMSKIRTAKSVLAPSKARLSELKTANLEETKKNATLSEELTSSAKAQSTQKLMQSIKRPQVSGGPNVTIVKQLMFNPYAAQKLTVVNKSSLINSTSNVNSSTFRPHSSGERVGGKTASRLVSSNAFSASTTAAEANDNIISQCDGLNTNDNVNGYLQQLDEYKTFFSPPDAVIAAGPNHVVEMANNVMKILDKNCNDVIPVIPLQKFFLTGENCNNCVGGDEHDGGSIITDPQILFDASSGHWFALILNGGCCDPNNLKLDCHGKGCSLMLAVSATDDPTGDWYHFNLYWGGNFPDQPIMVTSVDKVVINVNVNPDSDGGIQILALDKAALINTHKTIYAVSPVLKNEFSVHPALPLSSSPCVYMVSVFLRGTDSIRLSSFCGPVSSPNALNINIAKIPMSPSFTPSNGAQPGGKPIYTSDGRMITAVYYNGKIWEGFNDNCSPSNSAQGHPCVRIQKIDVNKRALLSDIKITYPNMDSYFPTLTVNGDGKMIFAFTESSSELQPSLFAGYIDNSSSSPHFYSLNIKSEISLTDNRFGDYLGASINPGSSSVWVALEYGKNIDLSRHPKPGFDWSTVIAQIS